MLKIETNSKERADRMRRLVEQQLGLLATYRIREHVDPAAHVSTKQSKPEPDEAPPLEVLEALRQIQSEHYRRWLDESIPALGGLTPREAARRTGKPRRELEMILAEIEHGEARRPETGRLDVAELRRELGVE